MFNPLTPELNPSAQRNPPRFFTGDFKFECLLLEQKKTYLIDFLFKFNGKILCSAYELVNLGKNVNLFS